MSEEELLLTHILNCTRAELLLNKPTLNPKQKKQFDEYKSRRKNGEPLQYILGEWDFHGLKFKVNPSVLVPRPETEILVEQAIRFFPPPSGEGKGGGTINILDLGTGSGNIAITLAKFLPNANVTTVDISLDALALAKQNAKYHGVEHQINFIHADIKKLQTPLPAGRHGNINEINPQKFNLIISNPPYIPTQQIPQLPKDVQQEPSLALDGGPDGLDFYRAIIKQAPMLLKPQGLLIFECGDNQAEAIINILKESTCFYKYNSINDLNNIPRIILAYKKP